MKKKNRLEGIEAAQLEEDTEYDDSNRMKHSLEGVKAAQLEEDTEYDDSNRTKHSLEGVEAPELDNTEYDDSNRPRHTLEGIEAPELDGKKPDFIPEPSKPTTNQAKVPPKKKPATDFSEPVTPPPVPRKETTEADKKRMAEVQRQLMMEQKAEEAKKQKLVKTIITIIVLLVIAGVALFVYPKIKPSKSTTESKSAQYITEFNGENL